MHQRHDCHRETINGPTISSVLVGPETIISCMRCVPHTLAIAYVSKPSFLLRAY